MSDDVSRPSDSRAEPRLKPVGYRSQLHLPLHYEPEYAYPLVIWLNRDADKPRNLSKFSSSLSLRNYVIAAPFLSSEWLERTHSTQTSALLAETMNHTIARASQRTHIHPKRIFLVTERDTLLPTLASIPLVKHHVRGVAVVNADGEMPTPSCTSMGKTSVTPPLFFCLQESRYRMQKEIEQPWRLYHSLGYSVGLKTITGGSGFRNSALRNIDRWIMETITGQPALDPEQSPGPSFCLN